MPEHTELSWLLSSVTSVGQLNRMHQFRDKAGAARERASAGLLFYPVLMAADVLAYRAHEVPVGEDQREHIELMRDVAEAFNKRFGETLVVPEGNIPTVGARVRDLKEPEQKMSTTGGTPEGHRLRRRGARESIVKKFKRRAADSGHEIVVRRRQARDLEPDRDPRRRPRRHARPTSSASSRAPATARSRPRWARRSPPGWRPTRERYLEIREDTAYIEGVLEIGAEKARAIAAPRRGRRARGDGRRARPHPRLVFAACDSPSSSWTSTSSQAPSTCCSR